MSKDRIAGSSLSGAQLVRGMLADLERAEVLARCGGEGLVVYRAQKFRAFSGARSYARERGYHDARSARAIRTQSRKGRSLAHHEWIAWEWQTLCRVHDAGADVPSPLACSDDAILMEYVGSAEGAAPQLRQVDLDPALAPEVFRRLLRNVEIFLACDLVHGDLSAYNVLWSDDRPWVIDVPQALDARTNGDAFPCLLRDVRNLERYFAPYGLDAGRFAERAWGRYRRGALLR